MDHFTYRDGRLHCEQVALDDLADRVGTPAYVYSKQTFTDHYRAIVDAFSALDPIVCYSIKSCGNLHIVKLLASMGSGMDVVSGGELYRARQAGADMSKVVYAGVGKTDAEITEAIEAEIGWFNIESEAEFENIARLAEQLGKPAHGALRINPDVADPRTHAKTTTGSKETKFGVDIARARRFFETYGRNPHCRLDAIHLHIGSPIYSPEPYVDATARALELIDELRAGGHVIDTIDIGGGYAADYESGKSPAYQEYADALVPLLRGKDLRVIIEPGRTIAGNAGVMVTQVQYVKESTSAAKRFVIVDAGMHNLVRPAMYDAFHFIWPTRVAPEHTPPHRAAEMPLPGLETSDIVGPICETGDTLAKARDLPPVQRGDRLCVFTAGAYGMVMASNYNAFPRPVEVLVDGERATVIRRRETYDDLVLTERDAHPV